MDPAAIPFDETVRDFVLEDPRYPVEAYYFVRDGFDYAMRARKAGYPSVIAPGIACTCPVRPNPGRTLAADFLLDLRSKGLFTAIWYFLRSAIRRFVIHNLSVYE